MITDTHSTSTLAARRPGAEQPLTGPARLLLILAATTITLVFYLGALLSLLIVLGLFLIELGVSLAFARFGLFLMSRPLAATSDLAAVIATSLWIGRDVEYTLDLQPKDAPRLFQLVERLAERVGVQPPGAIRLGMSDEAWIELRGYLKGRGRCSLGLGYDLLAALSEDELGAVIAHEMAHARLTQRGYRNWLFRALRRMRQLTSGLEELKEGARERKKRFFTAELLTAGANRLGRAASCMVGSYSRQDEFTADRLAAEVGGAQACRSALLTTAIVGPESGRLLWRERLAQADREECFSDWLRSRLLPRDAAEREEREQQGLRRSRLHEFSTHPALADRLAALPDNRTQPPSSLPALSLLGDPDGLAVRLLTEMERIAGEQERRHTLRRLKKLRSQRRPTNFTGGQSVGVLLLIVFGMPTILALGAAVSDVLAGRRVFASTTEALLFGLLTCIPCLGAAMVYLCRRKQWTQLPLPRMSLWEAAMGADERRLPIHNWQPSLEADMRRQQPAFIKRRKARTRFWSDQCYQALRECRYQQAYVAAQLCLKADRHSLEGLLGHGISAAYFGQNTEAGQSLSRALSAYGLGPSVSWAIGWAHSLWGNWDKGEMFLLDAVDRRPKEATLWSLLASCQWRQRKVREALQNLRQAVALEPEETRHRISLTRALLATGRPREASKELEILEQTAGTDVDVMLGIVRARLLLGQTEEAARHAESLQREYPGSQTLLRLAKSYAEVHLNEPARDYYNQLCRTDFYPEAWVGLASIEQDNRDHEKARACLMSALDVTREPGPDARKPLEMLEAICSKLADINEPVEGCSAWTAKIDMSPSPAPVGHLTLLVCDATFDSAREQVRWLYQAMHPGQELSDTQVTWEPLPADEEPEGPTAPGIYRHWLE